MVRFMTRNMLLLATFGVFLCANAHAETIFDAMSNAYNTNPILHGERAASGAINEDAALARSGFRPTVALQGSYTDNHSNASRTGGKGPTVDGHNKNYGGVVKQSLFSGFQTYNSVKSADYAAKAELFNLANVEQAVLLSASTAYLDVVRDEAIVNLQKNNEKLLKKQLDETMARYNVGEVTRTDVAQSRASYSQARSDLVLAEGNLAISRANYLDIVGKDPQKVQFPENLSKLFPTNYADTLRYAEDNNYALQAAKKALKAAKYNVNSKTGALLPEVSFTAATAKNKASTHTGYDPTTKSTEYTVDMNIPLYAGGATRAAIRKSKYQRWAAEEDLRAAESNVQLSVTSGWEMMETSKANIVSIREQVKASEVALEGTQKEEALGNRTVLDVLNAYQALLVSQVGEVKARHAYYVAGLQLMQAMGKLTAQHLGLKVKYYDAKEHYRNTKGKWLSLSIDED